MPTKNPNALEFLLTRRSCPAKTLQMPIPNREEVETILMAGARTPDHGKLEPWRFLVLEKPALTRLAGLASERAETLNIDADKAVKGISQYGDSHLAIAVVSAPVPSEKVPEIEQVYSAGAACLAVLNAALASGWGANWISGWSSHDRDFLTRGLDLEPTEHLAGLIFLGTARNAPPERPRPTMDAISKWVSS